MPAAKARPLYATLLEVAGLWAVADVGYWAVLPAFGVDLSYNSAPFIIALYFLIWSGVSIYAFADQLKPLMFDNRLWVQVVVLAAFGYGVAGLLYLLSQQPMPFGTSLAPYTDLLFATPWYFLPKTAEILLQQILIAALVFALAKVTSSLTNIVRAYALLFGGMHVLIFLLSRAPTPYATIMTFAAVASAAVFPFLMLRVRNGFVYSFMTHWIFYMVVALALHAWPPPGL